MLLLTGGEPFLYPELIKKIINAYGKRFIYRFNTSGYLLDKEMIEFLSHYNCDFVLSVDGDENLTNYLRPTRDKAYGVGYMEQFKEIVHTLLFYFPKTPYRIIIGPRYVDKLHEMYLYAETLGFRQFTFILDFESRPSKPIEGKPIWTQDKTEILKAELSKIVAEQIEGFKLGIQRPTVVELTQCLQWLAKSDNSFNPDLYPCRVFDGRTNYTMNAKQPIYCMDNYFDSMDDCKKNIVTEFNSLDGKCPINPDCSAFAYCANNCCPKKCLRCTWELFPFRRIRMRSDASSLSSSAFSFEVWS